MDTFLRARVRTQVRAGSYCLNAIFVSFILAIFLTPIEAAQPPALINASEIARLAKERAPESLIFLDASPQDIHQRVHLTASVRSGNLDATKRPYPLSTSVIVYDFSLGGNGATDAARAWSEAGYKSAHILRDGFAGAHAAKLPIDMAFPAEDALPYAVTAQSLADALKRKEEIILLDLRSEIEFSAKHIAGAINVKASDFLAKSAAWDKTKWIVLYDALGNSLDPLIWQLRKAGFLQTVSLTGGYKAWDAHSPQSPRPR